MAWANDIGARPESLRLEQATFEYERAKAQYDNVASGATPEDIQVARAQVAQAQAARDEVIADAHPADVAWAQANVRSATAALDLLKAGARPKRLLWQPRRCRPLRRRSRRRRLRWTRRILTAPFAGEVSSIAVAVGEFVAPACR